MGFRGVWKWFMEMFPSQQAHGARWALPWNVKHAAWQLGETGLAGHFKLFAADSLFRATSLLCWSPSWMLRSATLALLSWRGWTRCAGAFLDGRGTTLRCTWLMRTWWCPWRSGPGTQWWTYGLSWYGRASLPGRRHFITTPGSSRSTRLSKKPISRMVLSSFLSAIKGRQGARLPWGLCKGRGMLGVSQPLGTLSCQGLQNADRELKSCHFQQDWDSRLFISRHAVLQNKQVRGGNLVAIACPVSGQVSFSWICGQAQRENMTRKRAGEIVRHGRVFWEPLTCPFLSCLCLPASL